MTTPSDILAATSAPLWITHASRQLAEGFARQQASPQKAEQVYRNTLAVCLTQNYLRLLGIRTDLSQCDSWNPLMRSVMNVADLEVVGRGRLECRPLPETELEAELEAEQPGCYVPTEVQGDRIGYLVVQLNTDGATADLLGFTPQVEGELLTLASLRPLNEFPAYLAEVTPAVALAEQVTRLSQGFQNVVEEGWQRLEDLLGLRPVAWQWRSTSTTLSMASGFAWGKRLLADGEPLQPDLGLAVDVMAPELASIMGTGIDIGLKLFALAPEGNLPPGIGFYLLDADGVVVMQAQPGPQHQMVELSFQGEPGDRFKAWVVCGDLAITTTFLV